MSKEDEEAAAKAARKAARKAAKAAEAAEPEEAAEAEAEAEAEACRLARKAARRKAREEAAAAEAEEEEAEAEPKTPEPKAKGEKKRKAEEAEEEEEEEQPKAPKKLKAEDGGAVAKGIGAEAYRKAHQILVPLGCPAPHETFDDAAPALGKVLTKALLAQGYAAPTPIQAQGWPIALLGQDLVAVAKTGSGKTCGFLLPALARIAERGPVGWPKKLPGGWYSEPAKPTTLVLAPTRELAQQIAAEAEKFAPMVKARVVAIYGGVPKGDQVRELRQGCDILIATPGRLMDLAAGDEKREIRPAVLTENVNYLVLDEADRMLDMGFEPDIRKIIGKCPETGKPEEGGGASGPDAGTKRQTLFFTATWPKAVQNVASQFTSRGAIQARIGQGAEGDKLTANKNIKQSVEVLPEWEKAARLKELLQHELKEGETCIVFAGMKRICDELTQEVQRANLGLWCKTIHSGKEQWDRDEALAKFRELTKGTNGQRGVLIATDVAARGLDIPGVAMVVIYDFGRALQSGANGGVESYVHRIGRTGRAGKKGRAFTLFTRKDCGAGELAELLKDAGMEVPDKLVELGDAEWNDRWVKDKKKSFWKTGGKGGGKGKGGKGGGGKGGGRGGGGKGGGRGFR